jgi:FAD/FMN-containing dehydrogenase
LGGGIGWLVRRYGLAVDNLVGARVVTADGRLLTASADEHADLFWALRGGGGNFGVVVGFDFVAQPVATVHFAAVTYRLDDLASLLSRWRDAMRAAPDELSSTLGWMPAAPGAESTAMALLCYAGADEAEADAAFEPLFGLGEVTQAVISERRYGELLEHAEPPPGRRIAVRNALVRTLDERTIAAVDRLHRSGAPMAIGVRSLGGAFGRVSAEATAFAHRDAEAVIVGMLMLPGGAADTEVDRALGPWHDLAALGAGVYVNFQGSASADDLAAAYPPATYARLAAVKRTYDPDNVFARNHNIAPAGVGELARSA